MYVSYYFEQTYLVQHPSVYRVHIQRWWRRAHQRIVGFLTLIDTCILETAWKGGNTTVPFQSNQDIYLSIGTAGEIGTAA